MSEYYAVQRSTDHLAHYGVKGMKWGVRKAIVNQNEKALDRHFRKAARKLRKLQDIGLNSRKYAAKSAAYGVAAIGTGTIAVAGTKGINSMLQRAASRAKNKVLLAEHAAYPHVSEFAANYTVKSKAARALTEKAKRLSEKGNAIEKWGESGKRTHDRLEAVTKTVGDTEQVVGYKINKVEGKLNNNARLRIGAGIVTAGLAAKAAQNAYRAKNGAKYREKANDFRNAMDEVFSGTKYEGRYVAEPRRRRKRG